MWVDSRWSPSVSRGTRSAPARALTSKASQQPATILPHCIRFPPSILSWLHFCPLQNDKQVGLERPIETGRPAERRILAFLCGQSSETRGAQKFLCVQP